MENQNTSTNTESALEINVEQHLKFNAISDVQYINSTEFCELVSNLFKGIYSDYEGCRLVLIPQTNQIQLQLFFNHREVVPEDGKFKAISRDGKVTAANPTLAAIRRRDHLLNEGDRYYLTPDGKSGLVKFLFDGPTVFEKNGDVKWNRVVAEVSDSSNQYMSQQLPQQLTQISFIDPVKVAATLYGLTDDDGEQWVYNITVKRSIAAVNPYPYAANNNSNLILSIERISVEQTKKLAAQYGLVFTNGLGIVRQSIYFY